VLDLPIGNDDATEVIAKVTFPAIPIQTDPITLVIDCSGGSVTAGMAIIDTMQSLEPQVHSCIGQAHGLIICLPADLASLLRESNKLPFSPARTLLGSCPDSCPTCSLRGSNSLASGSGKGSLFPSRLAPAHVGFPERGEGSGYAVQFILKSSAFLLEFADYRLDQGLWHLASLSPELACDGRTSLSRLSFFSTSKADESRRGIGKGHLFEGVRTPRDGI
jgi:hypothetical protein